MMFKRLLVTLVAACSVGAPAWSATPSDWELVWGEEFNGRSLDTRKWDIELGSGFFQYDQNAWVPGWGNHELQYYTNSPRNVAVHGGFLHLRALREAHDGSGYTSGRIRTTRRDGTPLFSTQYGRVEFRAKLPVGRGLWPAVWMLPVVHGYGGWAASGEIDILEARGHEPDRVHGTLHYGSPWEANIYTGGNFVFPVDQSIGEFHVYTLDWQPGRISWAVDGKTYNTQTFWWSSPRTEGGKGAAPRSEADLNPWPAPFDKPFYLILNLAVGGDFLGKNGNPDANTRFPAEMVVDYLRVYRKKGGYGPTPPRGPGKLPYE